MHNFVRRKSVVGSWVRGAAALDAAIEEYKHLDWVGPHLETEFSDIEVRNLDAMAYH
jgi:hypothetical protein